MICDGMERMRPTLLALSRGRLFGFRSPAEVEVSIASLAALLIGFASYGGQDGAKGGGLHQCNGARSAHGPQATCRP